MINQAYQDIIQKISEDSSIPKQEVEEMVSKKLSELNELVSKEGAAHIVANELKVKIYDSKPKKTKVEDLIPGMNSIILTAKVINKYGVREFQNSNRKGKVATLLIADESGSIRLVVWDENIITQMESLNEEDIIKINNAFVRENNGFKEIHMGSRSQLIINPPGEEIGEVSLERKTSRKLISELNENDFVEIIGTVVQVFEPKSYDACPECNKKVFLEGENYICERHGKVTPDKNYILNLFLDDGNSNIRAVLFRENAESLIKENKENFENLKQDILGKQLILKGKVNKNEMFDRLEFVVNSVREVNPEELLNELQK